MHSCMAFLFSKIHNVDKEHKVLMGSKSCLQLSWIQGSGGLIPGNATNGQYTRKLVARTRVGQAPELP